MSWRIIFCGGLFWASAAFAVSRVGGGSITNVEEGLASMAIPTGFQQNDQVFSDDSVRLPGPIMLGGSSTGAPLQQLINIYMLRNEFVDLPATDDRAVFERYFENRHWYRLASPDPCLEIFELPTGSGFNMAVSWGGGRGLLLAGPRTEDVTDGIMNAVDSIKLLPGACGWK